MRNNAVKGNNLSNTSRKRIRNLEIKRCIDIIGSGVGLVILSPLFLLTAFLIKTTSKGPVFFRQERLGYHGKIFRIMKFRTMVVGAEQLGDGLKVKDEHDARITYIGRFIRKTSLDELPQLVNVLKGDMSLVGPRPPATYYPYPGYGAYPKTAKCRFAMRPGMTGLAQVKVRNSATWEERIRYDVEYVRKFNVLLDIQILFATVAVVLGSKDIYAGR
ncbi:MAG: sugar transferase [Lachnospiraceae bacterium]|nr:sugar transferase [Lachnospiraceae bacterium]